MNEIFLFREHAKIGENCKKYSTSVSYETLVGGTPTAGTNYEQTKCLSKGCVGYRFCKTMRFSYENLVDYLLQILPVFKKVCKSRRKCLIGSFNLIRRSLEFFRILRKNRDDHFLFNKAKEAAHCVTNVTAPEQGSLDEVTRRAPRGMTLSTLTLAAVLAIANISESRAECVGATETAVGIDSVTKAPCGICGTNCNWKIVGDTLKVTGGTDGSLGSIKDYGFQDAPWYSKRKDINSIEISGIKQIGNFAFASMLYEKISMTEEVKAINSASFGYNSRLKSVVIPAASLGYGAFFHNQIEEIIVSDEITEEQIKNWNPSVFAYNPEGVKIICQGNITPCREVMQKYVDSTCSFSNHPDEAYRNFCIRGAKFQKADYSQCLSANYFWNGASCIREPDLSKRKCCDSCKDMGGFCNRIRYTPAEAAEVLHDGSDNQIIMTFKVNR